MAIKKFKVGTSVRYRFNGRYSAIFQVISEKTFIKYDKRVKRPQDVGSEELVKQIKKRCRENYKCQPVFMIDNSTIEKYCSWMPEAQLMPWGKAAEILYE